MAPSPLPFQDLSPVPAEMTQQNLEEVASQFRAAAERSLQAGFEVLELHMAHGYLLHEFLSPLSNRRKDDFGGPLDSRLAAGLCRRHDTVITILSFVYQTAAGIRSPPPGEDDIPDLPGQPLHVAFQQEYHVDYSTDRVSATWND